MRGAVAVRVVADLGIVAVFGIALPDPGTKAKVAVSPRRGNAERLQWSPQRVAAASPARGRSRTVGLASREPLPATVLACGTTVPVSTCGYRSAGSGQCPSRRVVGTRRSPPVRAATLTPWSSCRDHLPRRLSWLGTSGPNTTNPGSKSTAAPAPRRPAPDTHQPAHRHPRRKALISEQRGPQAGGDDGDCQSFGGSSSSTSV